MGFQGTRWMIVYGSYEGLEGHAVNELYKAMQQFMPYVLTVQSADAEGSALADHHIALVGTARTNRHIARLAERGEIQPNCRKEGYAIRSCRSPFNAENEMVVISGADEAGVLYGVADFEHYYMDPAKYTDFPVRIYKLRNPFTDGMAEFEASSAPAVENRGLWTWGHAVYDYRRYIDHMSRWKLNTLIIWNDFAPLNIAGVMAYARSRGVRIVWAFSCSWGEEVDPTDEGDVRKWAKRALDTYKTHYAPYGADEIYFQLFTETSDETVGGESLARLAANWANRIAAGLLGEYPNLKIQFGLHALSRAVREGIECFRLVDPRVNITWEDCGSFPYHYDANMTGNHAETLKLTGQICGLRGNDEDFGIVVKGMTSLDWSAFEHQQGPFILGESKQSLITGKVECKRPYWKYVQSNWIKNLGCLTDTVRVICAKGVRRVTVTALAEDGGWEDRMWYPVALFAETLWDPGLPAEETLRRVAGTEDVYFA